MNKFIKRLIVLSVMLLEASSSIGAIGKNSVRILLILMGVAWNTLALAEGGCPEGQFPQQYGTTMGCTTMNTGGNQSVAPVWADRWGAIASDGNGTFGIVSNMKSKSKAQKAAFTACKNQGGTACIVKKEYHNQCVAVVLSETRSAYANAPTEAEALAMGKKECISTNTGECWVHYSGCSMPVRVN
ncbi:DUF4189 domain-containing protein [Acinetobacter higginsii]|uniref:DUF4189 domain-containing protein n=1 Tax=Acinetobacter higginsii TaxID=70347 RepID=UPI001F4B56DD|nr:DUF4189 domain-containing protein [Acinetobacter higginsii]MCH7294312.1 DUF4189 domain-containing protein [Acinetobacter higginsii]